MKWWPARTPVRALAPLLPALWLAACTLPELPSLPEPASLKDEIVADVARCDARHAHGPDKPAKQALAWRDCVHVSVRYFLLPAVRLPDLYRLLLVEDRRLVEAMVDGRIEREARARRLRELSHRIEAAGGDDPAPARPGRGSVATAEEIAAVREYLIDLLAE